MISQQEQLRIPTRGRGLYRIDPLVTDIVTSSGIQMGLCVLFCQHTSASLLIQENADPSAARDLLAWFERLAPDGDLAHTHTAEGPDDMPAHLRAAVTRSSESIPITGGRLALGSWQGLFLFEHRLAAHRRSLLVHLQGEA